MCGDLGEAVNLSELMYACLIPAPLTRLPKVSPVQQQSERIFVRLKSPSLCHEAESKFVSSTY
jgi:hypothetical protein